MKDNFTKWIATKLEDIGIDPIYFITIVCLLISFSYIKSIRNWDRANFPDKLIVISTFFGTTILTIISLFRILGIIKLE